MIGPIAGEPPHNIQVLPLPTLLMGIMLCLSKDSLVPSATTPLERLVFRDLANNIHTNASVGNRSNPRQKLVNMGIYPTTQ
jgi:hypothetical protein